VFEHLKLIFTTVNSFFNKSILVFFLIIGSQTYFTQLEKLEQAKQLVDSLYPKNKLEPLQICEANLEEAFALNDTNYITFFLDVAGEVNRQIGNYDKAISQLSQSLTYKDNWKDLKDLSITYNDLGRAYINKGQYKLASYNFLEALKLMETSGNVMGQGFYLNNLGALYDLQHNYLKAITYYEKSLQLKESITDSLGIAASSTNLGISYFNLGDYNLATKYHTLAIQIYKAKNKPTKLARSLSNLGLTYHTNKQYQSAEQALREAYNMLDLVTILDTKIGITNKFASLFIAKNQYDSALYYNSKALEKAQETNGFEKLRNIYKTRSEIFKNKNELDSALYSLNQSIAYDDSLINEANIYAVAEMEGKYEYEKNLRTIQEQELAYEKQQRIKETTEKELGQERLKFIYLVFALVVFAGFVVLIYVLYVKKKRESDLLLGQNALKEKQNKDLEHINTAINTQLDSLQITLDEKEKLLENVFTKPTSSDLPPELLALSKREMEVLSHLALGYSDEQLAEKLFISKSTVKTHLRRIYSKLLVRGRSEALVIAHKYGLIG